MKVFLSSDMEGTAGVVDWQQCVGYRSFCAAIMLTRSVAEAV